MDLFTTPADFGQVGFKSLAISDNLPAFYEMTLPGAVISLLILTSASHVRPNSIDAFLNSAKPLEME